MAIRKSVREQEIETNKELLTPQHREEKILVSDIGSSILGEGKSLHRRNIESLALYLVWGQIGVVYIYVSSSSFYLPRRI